MRLMVAGANEEGKQQRDRKAYLLYKQTYSFVIVNSIVY